MSMTLNNTEEHYCLGRTVPLTDTHGRELLPDGYLDQPLKGSVVLTQGRHGTAWQRHFKDGLWHSTRGGKAKTWEQMLDHRNLVLVYDAAERFDREDQP
jgi:hypothetical protein